MASLRANAVRGHSERQPESAAHSASMPGGLCSRDALVCIHNTCCCSWRDGEPVQGEIEASTRQLMRMSMHFPWRKCSTIMQLRGHSERLPISEVYSVSRPLVLGSRDAPLHVDNVGNATVAPGEMVDLLIWKARSLLKEKPKFCVAALSWAPILT